MKKVAVESSTCIACGLCPSEAPEVFEIKDKGYAEVIIEKDGEQKGDLTFYELDESQYEDVEYAQEGCPTESIKVIDED